MRSTRGEGKRSIEEPVSQLRKIKIIDSGEPLVNWLGHPRVFQDVPRFNYHRETIARASVVEFLWRAADALPKRYKLAVLEGWRPPYIQRRMFAWSFRRFKDRYPDWSETRLRRLASQFTAPMDEHVPPPHTTGGAIDLMLANENNEVLDHLSPYVPRDHKAFPFAAAGLSDDARRHRDMLAQAFSTGAMTNYPSEYWHWSYGDQGWAYRGRHEHALYSAVTPEGWEPSALDDTDEPLTWVMG